MCNILQSRYYLIQVLKTLKKSNNRNKTYLPANPECGAYFIKDDLCHLVSKDDSGAYKDKASLTPSTIDYYIKIEKV